MTLLQLARETWNGGAESVDDAVARMRREISADKDLYKELLEPIILAALRHAAQQAVHVERETIVRESRPSASLVEGIKQMAARNWLDFRLSGGRRLGECTGVEVSADADARQVRINTDVMRVRWMRLIVKSLSAPTAVVGAELTHEQLDALFAQAGNGKRVEVAA